MGNPIHRRSVDRFMAMADGREEVSVLASEYDALESENEALRSRLAEAEALLQKAEQNELLMVEKLDDAERALRVFHPMIDPFDATPDESKLWYEWADRLSKMEDGK